MPIPKNIDEYLARVRPDARATLERLRRTIQSAAPEAEECIAYQMPAFRRGVVLVAFAAWAKHCALYPMSSRTTAALAKDLAAFDTDRGTIRFTPERPLPAALVRKLVRARLAENAQRGESAQEAPTSRRAARAKREKASPRAATATRKPTPRRRPAVRDASEVDAFLAALDHPRKADVESVRRIVLAAHPSVREDVKWNAPSFRTTEYFVTLHLRAKDGVQIVLHRGAKKKEVAAERVELPDPLGLVRWLATDRCIVTLGAGKTLAKQRPALTKILRAWIRSM